MLQRLKALLTTARASLMGVTVALTTLALAPRAFAQALPKPPSPGEASSGEDDPLSYIGGITFTAIEWAGYIVGAALFLAGAIGMIWALVNLLRNRGTTGDLINIGLASSVGIAFGLYLLTQISKIIA